MDAVTGLLLVFSPALVLGLLRIDLPSPDALKASMKTDMEKLKRRQHYSGGWGFWQEEPWPF